jgi:CelD/BcsL family acetyltransferase involved in cellulose biosynthesis
MASTMQVADTTGDTLTPHLWEGVEGLRAVAPVWRSLLRDTPVDTLCNSPDWAMAHAEAFAAPDSIFGWTFTDETGRTVGVLPLRLEPQRSPVALRRAIFLADGTFDSAYLDAISVPGMEREVVEAGLAALETRRDVQAIVFAGVPETSPTLALLRERRVPRREIPLSGWRFALPSSLDEHLAKLEPDARERARTAERWAKREGGTMKLVESGAELEQHLEGLFELHTRAWRARGEQGRFVRNRRQEFYRKASRWLLTAGRLRFARLEIGGKPIAYLIGALGRGAFHQMQEGWEPDLRNEDVTTALRVLLMRHLIDEGVTAYDFFAGRSGKEPLWGAEAVPCTTVGFALSGLRARLHYGARTIVDRLRGTGA